MKTIKLLITGAFFLLFSLGVLAQGPPNPPGGHGGDEDAGPAGGGAPVGSGIVIMTILSAAYGGKKAFENKRKSEKEN